MIGSKRVIAVLPAYNCEKTLGRTVREIPRNIIDGIILVDDKSKDHTVAVAESLGLKTITHEHNLGYGANQKTCYHAALREGADIVVMLHPDYQYTPKLLPALVHLVASGVYDVALGSRILGKGWAKGGMPLYKYVSNRFLTFFQNVVTGQKLSEFHTGYRAFSREALETLHFDAYGDGFIFDNQILCEVIYRNLRIGEISCPTAYFPEASSIGIKRSLLYGLGVLRECLFFLMVRAGLRIRPYYK
jgi:glycosyltransferase involved in cell wall biosynthesis